MRSNRFIIKFPEQYNLPSNLVKSASRPSCTRRPLHGLPHILGPLEWDNMDFTFHDRMSPSTSAALFRLLPPNDILLSPMEIKVKMLDPTGGTIQQWIIIGHVTSINFGELNYSSEDLLEISMTIKPLDVVMDF